jgi:hypothetical protein
MKNFLKIILAIAIVLLVAVGLSACNGSGGPAPSEKVDDKGINSHSETQVISIQKSRFGNVLIIDTPSVDGGPNWLYHAALPDAENFLRWCPTGVKQITPITSRYADGSITRRLIVVCEAAK